MSIKSKLASLEAKVDRAGKPMFAFICWIVILTISSVLGTIIPWSFGMTVLHSCLFGLAIGFLTVSFTINPFLVSVPEVTGLLTINLLKDKNEALTPYGTGFHFRYPWEQVKEGNYINLRQITETIDETYPSKDSHMKVKLLFQYTPSLVGLPRYISADDNTIKKGLRGIASSVLGVEISNRTGETGKNEEEMIEEAIKRKFTENEPTPLNLYGINIDRVSIADFDYDDSVQQARSSQEVAARVQAIASTFKKRRKGVSDKDALNAALIINKNITKNVYEVEGIGPVLAAIIDAFRGKKQ